MAAERSDSMVTVFGSFCPEKGRDLEIDALRHCRAAVMLRLAGGPWLVRCDDSMARCRQRITEFGLADRVVITGFVPEEEIAGVFLTSDLILAPFCWTSGSGSLACTSNSTAGSRPPDGPHPPGFLPIPVAVWEWTQP